MALYKVETISQFKMTYFIEADEKDHANDAIVMKDSGNEEDFFDDAHQEHLGEVIFSTEEITKTQFNTWLNEQRVLGYGSNCSHWMGDKLIHKIDYDDMPIQYADTDEEFTSANVFRNTASRLILEK